MGSQFVVVEVVSGRTEAEIFKAFLQAHGITCELSQEAAGWIHGFTIGPLAQVEILVPSHQYKDARNAIKKYCKTKGKNH